jgi:hypothetical protein
MGNFVKQFVEHSRVLKDEEEKEDLLTSTVLLKDLTGIPLSVFNDTTFNSTKGLCKTLNVFLKYDIDIYPQLLQYVIDNYIYNLIDTDVIGATLIQPITNQIKTIIGDNLYKYIFNGDHTGLELKDIVLSVELLHNGDNHVEYATEDLFETIAKYLTSKHLIPVLEYCGEKYGFRSADYSDIAKHGNLSMMKYIHQNGGPSIRDERIISSAAKGGYLDCLKYAHENGCNWSGWFTLSAAEGGNIDCLKYVYKNSISKDWNDQTTSSAAVNGHIECLKYAHENGCDWNEQTTSSAAMNGHIECLKYAHENGCDWGEWTTSSSAKYGHIECLKYAHENGCPWHKWTTSSAANHLECMKYAHENGCEWHKWTTSSAAEYGQLECLKYAHENGCEWNVETIKYAAKGGQLECLKYAHEHGCEWHVETTKFAAQYGNFKCLGYIQGISTPV